MKLSDDVLQDIVESGGASCAGDDVYMAAELLQLREQLRIAKRCIVALSENHNFCMGEYIGEVEEFSLRSDVVIARETLAKLEEMETK
jgi:hypothetical protein